MNILESLIAKINKKHFLSEFTFAKNQFEYLSNEVEFADCFIWLEEEIAIFQLKERTAMSSNNAEHTWFEKKVIQKAKKQMQDSMKFFQNSETIEIENIKGHKFNIKSKDIKNIHKVIIYKHPNSTAGNLKFIQSSEIDFIHIFDYYDYLLVCEILDTPKEIFEYLMFRKNLLVKFNLGLITEKSILGLFLKFVSIDNFMCEPKYKSFDVILLDYEEVVDKFKNNKVEYDIDYILTSFNKKKFYMENRSTTDYYKVLIEFVKMNRNERKMFKERWETSAIDLLSNKSVKPYRIIVNNLTCGIIFIPLPKEKYYNRLDILQCLTQLSKHNLKLDKHLGISFCKQNNIVDIDYIYLESPWMPNNLFDEIIENNNLFRPLKEIKIERYKFEN